MQTLSLALLNFFFGFSNQMFKPSIVYSNKATKSDGSSSLSFSRNLLRG